MSKGINKRKYYTENPRDKLPWHGDSAGVLRTEEEEQPEELVDEIINLLGDLKAVLKAFLSVVQPAQHKSSMLLEPVGLPTMPDSNSNSLI